MDTVRTKPIPNKGVITFITLNKTKLYGVYEGDVLMNDIISSFNDNHTCTVASYCTYYCPELGRNIDESDLKMDLSELKLDNNITIELKCDYTNYIEYTRYDKEIYQGECGPIQVLVKTLTGRSIMIDADISFPLGYIKKLIYNREGIHVEKQILIICGKQHADSVRLRDIGIIAPNSINSPIIITLAYNMGFDKTGKLGNYKTLTDDNTISNNNTFIIKPSYL